MVPIIIFFEEIATNLKHDSSVFGPGIPETVGHITGPLGTATDGRWARIGLISSQCQCVSVVGVRGGSAEIRFGLIVAH